MNDQPEPIINDTRPTPPQDPGTLLLAVAVDRATGKITIANAPLSDEDLPMALQAVRMLGYELEAAMLRAAEERGRRAAQAENPHDHTA